MNKKFLYALLSGMLATSVLAACGGDMDDLEENGGMDDDGMEEDGGDLDG
ncbi:hypothetical protein B0H94_11544 [Salsuginibacillus halophilus]|uniref:Uncharacterized protein n=1 Tax=Salsuginibacillus halophilus TaxID=517424 RepID=A0A2P8H8D1_9BACI|nr:hypothetical protein [Salsuginibacillus halophilus]PSL42440.1 hypothetical protein B0H94_11544 [Salsuginibacillus halophilus]